MSTARITPGDGDPRHGSTNGYGNLRCRCQPCRDAWAATQRAMRAARVERGRADPSLIPHGTYSGYSNWGCRCEPCRSAAGHGPASVAECGTRAGGMAHYRRGEAPCDPCRQACRDYETARRRARGVSPLRSAVCGTTGGYNRHLRLGEPTCDACRAEEAARGRARHAAGKKAS